MPAYDVREAFERIELSLIRSMARNLRGHRDWELSEGFDWTAWQVEQHRSLRAFSDANARMCPEQFGRINAEIDGLIRSMHGQGGLDEEAGILSALRGGYRPPRTPLDAEGFFGVDDAKLQALLAATRQDMERAEHAVLRFADDQYRRVIFNAQVYANTGAASLHRAVDMATKDFLSKGISCIEYSDGRRVNIASYAEMAVRTANKRAYVQAQGDMRRRWGMSLVEVAPNGAACPRCLPWLGRVLVDDVWSGGAPDGRHALMSEAIAQGLYHPNCRDVHTTWLGDGDDEEAFEYTDAQREADEERYRVEQGMRTTANGLQRARRLEVGSLLPENRARAAGTIGRLRDAWNAQAAEARKTGIIPPGFVAAGQAWESIKASVRSVYAPKGPYYATAYEKAAATIGSRDRRLVEAELARRDPEWVKTGKPGKTSYDSEKLREQVATKRAHEALTSERLNKQGLDFHFIEATNTYRSKTLDGMVDPEHRLWELKAPSGDKQSTIDNLLRDAKRKEADYVVIDNQPGRTALSDAKLEEFVRRSIKSPYRRFAEVLIVRTNGDLLRIDGQ
ncbi:MAG: hypothetical protein LBL86_12170 [Coriobacteriales bacterium]|jgi:hypothetical protein|nr:hypothetical protein [Coriobacteriales bacterium]